MKYFIAITICIFFFVQSTTAQFKTGMITVGGSVSASGSNGHSENSPAYTEGSNLGLSFSPTIGYYYSDHSAVGSSLNLGLYKSKRKYIDSTTSGSSKNSDSYYSIAPFWRHNKTVTDKFGLYAILSPNIGYSVSDATDQGDKSHWWTFGVSTRLGAYYFPFEKISAEIGFVPIDYSYMTNYRNDTLTSVSHHYSFNFQTSSYSLSFFYHFTPK